MLFGVFTIFWLTITAICVPKRNSKIELYATSTAAVLLGTSVDEIMDLKLNLYGFLNIGVDILGETSQLIIYSTANIIFLSLFPYNGRVSKKIFYILACSLFATFYEYLSVNSLPADFLMGVYTIKSYLSAKVVITFENYSWNLFNSYARTRAII